MTLRSISPARHASVIPKSRHIDLLRGWPNPSLLPPRQLDHASTNILSDPRNTADVLCYAPDEGYGPLRTEIARWLTEFYQPSKPITDERICISGGASQNLACILQTFTDAVYTRNVWMVAPTYYLACRIFTDNGFDNRLRAVPEDDEGIDLEYLERGLKHSEDEALRNGNTEPRIKTPKSWRKIYKHIIYAVPTFANPSGRLMSFRRRQQLVRLARKYDALVVTDDVYDMLQWPSDPKEGSRRMDRAVLPRIVDIDRDLDGGPIDDFGHAVSNGSFSKIVAPGCRTGWAEGTPALAYGLSQTGSSRSGGAPSHLVASFMYQLLAEGTLQRRIYEELQPGYSARYYEMMSAIKQHLLPLGLTMPQANKSVAGGYFIWLTLPGSLDSTRVYKRALAEENLTIISGPRFKVDGDEQNAHSRFESDLRLCYAWEDKDVLAEGVIRLARVIQREMKNDLVK
ncbi:Valine--pyruvate aminotransferase [Cladophialophora chaetospira]|uniref:Valine--pyruvate aminotransferase n=1 Tax=Cladophialophora chaetospira TaxID=386627 RepID=A0AA39CF10_9EURO|nr:Valine--pyruvate aminotransferase [Cladophialophora chaetospira]